VRLVTFNILNGRSTLDDRVDVERFADAVKTLDPDVLALQEVDRGQARSGGADLTAVAAEAMGARAHHFVAALTGTPGGTWVAATGAEQPDSAAYGVALLSRYPVDSWRAVRLSALPAPAPYLFHGARRPSMVRDEPRVAAVAALDTPRG
jgi:endonuclease/exonuclease/phosphatase family metal-dependent hydrolase